MSNWHKPTTLIFSFSLFATALITGCASKNASHLPSVLELPGMVIGGSIENARYNARRERVSKFVQENYDALRQDAENGGGATLEQAFKVAKIKKENLAHARKAILENTGHTFRNNIIVADHLTNAFIPLYQVKQGAKKINGLSHPEINNIILNYSQDNFDPLRTAILHGNGKALDELGAALGIKSAQILATFKLKSQALYSQLYLEPIVVTFMVFG